MRDPMLAPRSTIISPPAAAVRDPLVEGSASVPLDRRVTSREARVNPDRHDFRPEQERQPALIVDLNDALG
jgi:hypothetical protein